MDMQEAYYVLKFENEFYRAKGSAFQALFERLMSLAYRADFMACCPWGREGDRKNDGFLKSERRLFQVYAPNEMKAAQAKAKISADFHGALNHWGTHFDKWSFVHNATEGLSPPILQLLLDFESENPGVQLDPWGLADLQLIFHKLSDDDKASWFGPAPTEKTKTSVGFKDLQVVLESISALPAPPMPNVKDVPAGKIEANALSDAVSKLLREGMLKSPLVADFLSQWHDETLGEKLAEAFNANYRQLRQSYGPNQIFIEFQSWAGGHIRGNPEHEMAVLAVIAYYFERCDIFEEPRGAKL